MLIGLFLKSIKSYENTSFIPTVKNNKPFSFYIGENGVGKSSILEALDIYFNKKREWNINEKNKKKNEVFIAPIFLIKKNLINLKDDELKYLESISDTLLTWDIDKTSHIKSHPWVINFYSFLSEVKHFNNVDDYYIIITPLFYDKKVDTLLFTFESFLTSNIENYDLNIFKNLIEKIRLLYSYIYIPVETPVEEVLKMETPEMQMLLSEDILKFTENMLLDKNISEGNKKVNIVDKINNKLDSFMIDVNYTISRIDTSYAYSADGKFKKNLTAIDIREHIFKAYFSLRNLSKNRKDIVQLSSGEKRKALIDIATAFLKQESKRAKNVILAIDEPETSMHMNKVFAQFKQLELLTIQNNIQFIGTTHWYGFLPITDYGNLNHISNNNDTIDIKNLDFYNLFERDENFPDDIIMKSFFELVTSILTSIKSTEYKKWIICEGSDDKKYLEYYLKQDTKNKELTILPVSGCGNVRKLYHLLYASLSEKDKVKLDGKILCLLDTDLGSFGLNNNTASDKDKIIFIRRLQINSNQILLEKISSNNSRHFQTEVEDCLEPNKYFKALKYVTNGTNVEEIFNSYEQNTKCEISRVINSDGESLLQFNEKDGLSKHVNLFKELTKFLELTDTKQKICHYYTGISDIETVPSWINDIVTLLELDVIEIQSKPTATGEVHEVAQSKPTVTEEVHEVAQSKPTATEEVHEVAQSKPTVTEEVHEVAQSKPTVTEEVHEVAQSKLTVTEEVHEVAQSKPTVTEEVHEVAQSKPTVTEEVHEVAQSKPTVTEEVHEVAQSKPTVTEEVHEEVFVELFKNGKTQYKNILEIDNYIKKNHNNIYLHKYISDNFLSFLEYPSLLNTLLDLHIMINFNFEQLIKHKNIFIKNHVFYSALLVIFTNNINITEKDLDKIAGILNSNELDKNAAVLNEFYFAIYISIKLKKIENIKIFLNNSVLLNLTNSMFTILYLGHYNKYIKIGYEFNNIVALSNNMLNSKSYSPYVDIYIHALKKYNVFDKLLEEDKKKTFANKLNNYYKEKPTQINEYNKFLNIIFKDLNI